jgi:Cu+-exporting ATPase
LTEAGRVPTFGNGGFLMTTTTTDQKLDLQIEGMHCSGCVKRVKSALEKIPGVVLSEVTIGKATGTINIAISDLEAAVDAVSRAGYRVRREPELG